MMDLLLLRSGQADKAQFMPIPDYRVAFICCSCLLLCGRVVVTAKPEHVLSAEILAAVWAEGA